MNCERNGDMILTEVIEAVKGTVVTDVYNESQPVSAGFVGDLLSVVMGKAEEDCAWVTIQSHINIIAVATLVGAACIIVAEGYQVDGDAIAKAKAEEITVIATEMSSFEAVSALAARGLK